MCRMYASVLSARGEYGLSAGAPDQRSCANHKVDDIGNDEAQGRAFARQLFFGVMHLSFSDIAQPMRDPGVPSEASIKDWGHRVSDARARITSEIRAVDDASPLRREGKLLLDELALAFEELQVAEEELHVQTEELSASRVLLEGERLRYRALFEHAPVPYLVTNPQGVISDANRAAAMFLRVPPAYLRGKPLVVFVSPARRRAFRE